MNKIIKKMFLDSPHFIAQGIRIFVGKMGL